MAAIDQEGPSRGGIPHLCPISPRCDLLAIGRPRHNSHFSNVMATIGQEGPSRGGIPHLCRISSRGDLLAIRRPRHSPNTATMATIGEEKRSERVRGGGLWRGSSGRRKATRSGERYETSSEDESSHIP